jgi:membrane associated rhomboid family serine protease
MEGRSMSPFRMTPAVKALLVANLAVYVVELLVANWLGYDEAVFNHLALSPSRVFRLPLPEIWQPFTYMWLHDNVLPSHLLMNMLGLWMFGGLLEMRWGSRSFVRFWVLCGIIGGLGFLTVASLIGWNTRIVGASGAVFGLLVAFGILYKDLQVYLMFMIPMRGRTLVLLFVGIELLTLLTRTETFSVVAHLSGAAGGWLLVTGYWRPSRILARFRSAMPPPRPKARKRADHLRVVPEEEEDKRYLH